MIIPFGCIFWLRQKINKTVMKKFTIKFIPTLIMFLIPLVSFAQDVGYKTLVGLPGLKSSATGEVDFDTFINSLYAMSIGIAALLAVIKIIIAGVKYMLTDIITSKEEAKKEMTSVTGMREAAKIQAEEAKQQTGQTSPKKEG